MTNFIPHSSHWGVFQARVGADQRVEVRPYKDDTYPNRIIENYKDSLDHSARIRRPAIRRSWLENGPGSQERKGDEPFIEVDWGKAISLVSRELIRIKEQYGNTAIYGGSYGWASAGRFHHALSQIHRFLNATLGGYTSSINTYSAGSAEVLTPHVLGNLNEFATHSVTWEQIKEHTEVIVAFGGMATKNGRVAAGGVSDHMELPSMRAASSRGCKFVLISPRKTDLSWDLGADWIPCKPGTDAAFILGLCYEIVYSGKYDREFLNRYTIGWAEFKNYLFGKDDGQPKTARWAANICGISHEEIIRLAGFLPGKRSLIVLSHSLQRAEHGEQALWMGLALSCILGQIGLPGGGYAYPLGAIAYYGRRRNLISLPRLSQFVNNTNSYIPVARISDMLLNPGGTYPYNGEIRTYPLIKLAYWAGGNPFHHHQDLMKLQKAISQLDTFIVHESFWTATARRADIVLPSTLTLERSDIGGGTNDPLVRPMRPICKAYALARDDYAIFSDIAHLMGKGDLFTEGRSAEDWLQYFYAQIVAKLEALGKIMPTFEEFWNSDGYMLPQKADDGGFITAFRKDPGGAPLETPSGKIELFSRTIQEFRYATCLGHPSWIAPTEFPNNACPLYLITTQPDRKLHSQLDFSEYSQAGKIQGREIVYINPHDAEVRNIEDGDIIRLSNKRGACLGAAKVTENIRRGVVQVATGSWFEPLYAEDGGATCIIGNPNVLTRDIGTSELAQGSTGAITVVEVMRYEDKLPAINIYEQPNFISIP